ncbi:MAG: ABC transporter permease [Planctomycetaceae bacterium]
MMSHSITADMNLCLLLSAALIPLERLALALIPVVILLIVLRSWSIAVGTSIFAIGRMLLQLFIIGYLLRYIFEADSPLVVLGVLSVMLLVASWISLRVTVRNRRRYYLRAFAAISISGGFTLMIVTQGVLQLDPWYSPDKMIPLAGMIFSSCMNAVGLSAERYLAELSRGVSRDKAARTAIETSLIPITNSLFAVGVVSIPGMMTGQVLAGAAPQIAARYQIMVMCMMFASAGLASVLVLHLMRSDPAERPSTPADGTTNSDDNGH